MTEYLTGLGTGGDNDGEFGDVAPALIEADAITIGDKQKVFRKLIGPRGIRNMGQGPGISTAVPQIATVTFAAATETTNDTEAAFNPTVRTLTPVSYGATIVISYEAVQASLPSAAGMIAESAGLAAAVLEDDSAYGFAGLYGEPSSANDIGAQNVPMDAALIRQGVQKLMTAYAPKPFNWVIDPLQWGELMADPVAMQWLQNTRAGGLAYAATTGVQLDRYLGQIYGCNIWVGNKMISSTGYHSLAFGQDTLGIAYREMTTPNSPVASELKVDWQWNARRRAWDVVMTVCMDASGIAFTATTNDWLVNAISNA